MDAQMKNWPHAPAHLFVPQSVYIVTGATLYRVHWYKDSKRLELLENVLFDILHRRRWELQAWSVFSNHYHFIAKSPEVDSPIDRLIQHFHSEASRQLNLLDGAAGRTVWYQYWDTCLTFEKSYLARLNYVMKKRKMGTAPETRDSPHLSIPSARRVGLSERNDRHFKKL